MNNKSQYGEIKTPRHFVDEVNEKLFEVFVKECLETKVKNSLQSLSKSQISQKTTKQVIIRILDVGTGNGIFIQSMCDIIHEYFENNTSEIEPFLCGVDKILVEFVGIEKNPEYRDTLEELSKVLKSCNLYTLSLGGKKSKSRNIEIHTTFEFILEDFHVWVNNSSTQNTAYNFDMIIGNPPFNNDGGFKVPSNKTDKKTSDGKSVWRQIIKDSINLLDRQSGLMGFIVPNGWLKPDKFNMYDVLLNQNTLRFLKSYDSAQCHKIFEYNAQLPFCYFVSRCGPPVMIPIPNSSDPSVDSYQLICIEDSVENESCEFPLIKNFPIPTHNIAFISTLSLDLIKGNFNSNSPCQRLSDMVKKTNVVNEKNNTLIPYSDSETNVQNDKSTSENEIMYINIASASFPRASSKMKDKQKVSHYTVENLKLKLEHSLHPCPFYGVPKFVCPHKRMPVFMLDKNGKYGISRRDNYVLPIPEYMSEEDIEKLHTLLNSEITCKVLKSFQYRMNYIEKYGFEYMWVYEGTNEDKKHTSK